MQYSDYAVRVLLAEVMIKIVMDLKHVNQQTAEEFIDTAWYLSLGIPVIYDHAIA
jgi:hypothetical protein